MKKNTILTALILSITLSFISFPQEAFEGLVEYKILSNGQSSVLRYLVKDSKMKIDVTAESDASMIYDNAAKTMIVILPDQKMYMEMPIKMNPQQAEEIEKIDTDFKNTGETKEVLGYTCEKWIYSDEENDIEAWLTKELGSFMFFSNPMEGGQTSGWQSRLEQEGYFPMEVNVKQHTGEEMRMQITTVEPKTVSSDIFQIPAGYQKIDMPAMQSR